MNNRTNLNTLLFILVFLLAMVGTTFAESSLLWPLQAGQRYEYDRSDSTGNKWPVHLHVKSQVTIGSFDYFHIQKWNFNNDSVLEDRGYIRSTEDELYSYNQTGDDYLDLQKAAVGTSWNHYEPDGSGLDYVVVAIDRIEPVTVPYGVFSEAYVHRKYRCVDPDNLSIGQSPDWYEWIVPGIGYVKDEDWWPMGKGNQQAPSTTVELVRVIIAADIDVDPDTLNLRSKAKWIRCYIRLAERYDVADIEPVSILLNGEVAPERCRVHKAKQMLIVRFYRSEVQAIVEPGDVELTISGELTDGTKFEGADTITVID